MQRVLVTRPEPGASRTARLLKDMGFLPLLLPLTETVALPIDTDLVIGNAVAVAVTSANGVRFAPKEVVARLSDLPCHAVGKRTAQAARKAGFLSVSEGPGNAEGLAGSLAGEFQGKTIVYLCGRVRFPAFEQRLQAADVGVRPVETYDTLAVTYSDEAVLARLSGQTADAVLLYSARAAAALQALVRRPALHEAFDKTRVFALSHRIAAVLGDVAGDRIHIAARPDEGALLSLLRPGS
ncbi:uroporphyrinogen-III synthase [Mesorhizobium sp. BR1-1-14]|uniref:uroporphyrinogen-III synthase n=1 Tax=Mesorhizobium sp. BR1-1-14 TaxID=2876655 RepID=UPI001CD14B9E|nr:uroporphyrinogen-III synthase [Mesorhizobium sp. BR1-1-14]MBZ9958341.1 uroporphyrinogen-III synthase [Mesorhizobium sp. BR1-1-14]